MLSLVGVGIYFLKVIPIFLTCFAADYLLKSNVLSYVKTFEEYVVKALCDNIAHGSIAALTWLVVVDYNLKIRPIVEVGLCGLFGSLIDTDHFLNAKSIYLKDALNLPSRPPFHNTTIIFLLIPFYGLPYILPKWEILHKLVYILFVAVTSHHLRDANRRGLWFWPFGSTPRLPDLLYMSCISILPLFVWLVQKHTDYWMNKQVNRVINIV